MAPSVPRGDTIGTVIEAFGAPAPSASCGPDGFDARPASACALATSCSVPDASVSSTKHESAISGTARRATCARVCSVLERFGEYRRRVGEERRAAASGLGVVALGAELGVELGPGDRGGRQVGERLGGLGVSLGEGPPIVVIERERGDLPIAEPHRTHEHRLNALVAIPAQLRREQRLRLDVLHRQCAREELGPGAGTGVVLDDARGETLRHANATGDAPDLPVEVVDPDCARIGRQQLASERQRRSNDILRFERIEQPPRRRHEQRESSVQLGALGFVAPSHGDVARHFRGADDAAVGGADRRDHEGDRDARSVLALTDRLHVDRLAGANVLEDQPLLGKPLVRNDERDWVADRLGGRVAKEPLGGWIPRRDDAVEVLADNRVSRRFDQRGELLRGSRALDGEGDLRGDDGDERELVTRRRPRLVTIEHELADQARRAHQRDEDHRRNALGLDRSAKRRKRGVGADVADHDEFGVGRRRRPGCVPLDRRPIGGRQPTPGLETHDAVGVEQEDRGARGARDDAECVERRLIDLVDGSSLADRARQFEADGQCVDVLAHGPGDVLHVKSNADAITRRRSGLRSAAACGRQAS